MAPLGKVLIILGIILIGLGLLLNLSGKIPWLGKLPGDIHIEGKHGSFYFPIVTCIIISIILTLILNIFFGK